MRGGRQGKRSMSSMQISPAPAGGRRRRNRGRHVSQTWSPGAGMPVAAGTSGARRWLRRVELQNERELDGGGGRVSRDARGWLGHPYPLSKMRDGQRVEPQRPWRVRPRHRGGSRWRRKKGSGGPGLATVTLGPNAQKLFFISSFFLFLPVISLTVL